MLRLYLVPRVSSEPTPLEQRAAKVIELRVRRLQRTEPRPPHRPPRPPEAA
jgi:hypothetical protein